MKLTVDTSKPRTWKMRSCTLNRPCLVRICAWRHRLGLAVSGAAPFEKAIGRQIEGHPAALGHDLRVLARGDEAALGEIEILAVVFGDQPAGFFERVHGLSSCGVFCGEARPGRLARMSRSLHSWAMIDRARAEAILMRNGWFARQSPGLRAALLARARIEHAGARPMDLWHRRCAERALCGAGGHGPSDHGRRRGDMLLEIVQPGQLFGQAARFGGGPRLVTAIAGERATLAVSCPIMCWPRSRAASPTSGAASPSCSTASLRPRCSWPPP